MNELCLLFVLPSFDPFAVGAWSTRCSLESSLDLLVLPVRQSGVANPCSLEHSLNGVAADEHEDEPEPEPEQVGEQIMHGLGLGRGTGRRSRVQHGRPAGLGRAPGGVKRAFCRKDTIAVTIVNGLVA